MKMIKNKLRLIKFSSFVLVAMSSNIMAQDIPSTVYIKEPLIFDNNGNSVGCNPYTEYYPNGRIKEVGCQGYYDSQGTTLGTVYQYNETGKLERSIYYHPDKFGKDYKVVREYDQENKVISEKIYNNDVLYEVDEKELDQIPD